MSDRTPKPSAPERIYGLLGLGVEADDAHVRISQGKHFQILLGSDQAHETMLQLCIRINALLEERGLEMRDLTKDEFVALLRELESEAADSES